MLSSTFNPALMNCSYLLFCVAAIISFTILPGVNVWGASLELSEGTPVRPRFQKVRLMLSNILEDANHHTHRFLSRPYSNPAHHLTSRSHRPRAQKSIKSHNGASILSEGIYFGGEQHMKSETEGPLNAMQRW